MTTIKMLILEILASKTKQDTKNLKKNKNKNNEMRKYASNNCEHTCVV